MARDNLADRGRFGREAALGALRNGRRAVGLVWTTDRRLALLLGVLVLVSGIVPAATAYVGREIVDEVIAAANGAQSPGPVFNWIVIEACLVALLVGSQRGAGVCQSLLRARLGHRVNVMILEKAIGLDLVHFEDSEFYDKFTRARREASTRPVSLVNRTFSFIQNVVALVSFSVILAGFSTWAALLLLLAGLPAFIVETKFSGDGFALFRRRSPEARMQAYLETVLAREDYAKEIQLYQLGPTLLNRYREIFGRVFAEERSLTLRRGLWGYVVGLVSLAFYYVAYAWIAVSAVGAAISIGAMTMYLILIRQGQSAVAAILSALSGMFEDHLYISTLYEYLGQEVEEPSGRATVGTVPGDGIRFQGVSFTYRGAAEPSLRNVSLHIRAGETLAIVGKNGSGKTTLIKLLSRLYRPTAGRITLDGRELDEWDETALRRRIGVIFQDFARYQLIAGENIGAGDARHFADETRWRDAARQGMAETFVEAMPRGYQTQLGRWFKDGRELSGGQWQKIALARAFMRSDADILVLDEPTSAMDATAEARIFGHVHGTTGDRMTILISHRFSTVRTADHIVVLDRGEIVEEGSHEQLMAAGALYSRLFTLQAEGYR